MRLPPPGLAIAATVLFFLLGGCKVTQVLEHPVNAVEKLTEAKPKLTENELRQQLYLFADEFAASIASTVDLIASQTRDPKARDLTIRWKIRVIPTMQRVVGTAEPRQAYLDAWMICIQQRNYLITGLGSKSFGDQQTLAVDMANQLVKQIEEVGRGFMSAAAFEKAQATAEKYANEFPVAGDFVAEFARVSHDKARKKGFSWTEALAYPLKPITGLSDTATAVADMRTVGAALALVVRSLPERTRWQTELLLLHVESMKSVDTGLQDLTEIAQSFDTIGRSTEALPTDLRNQMEAVLEATDAPQTKLQETMQAAQKTVEDLNQTMTQAYQLGTTIETSTANLNKAAVAWDQTAHSVNDVMKTIQAMSDEPSSTSEDDAPPFDILDYERTAQEIQKAAIEVRGLLGDIESPPAKGDSPTTLSQFGDQANASIDHATLQVNEMIRRLRTQGLMLIGAALLAALLYRFTVIRIIKPTA